MSAAEMSNKAQLFLTRGVIAVVWAVVFAAASDSLTVGVGVLLVLYPLLDVIASLIDARHAESSARTVLLANAAFSTAAAIALGIAATGSVADVIGVFGLWAFVSGAAQIVTALRRRAQLGNQWPMFLAGGVSVIAGLLYIINAVNGDPHLRALAIYAAGGGIEFIIQSWLVVRRRRHGLVVAA